MISVIEFILEYPALILFIILLIITLLIGITKAWLIFTIYGSFILGLFFFLIIILTGILNYADFINYYYNATFVFFGVFYILFLQIVAIIFLIVTFSSCVILNYYIKEKEKREMFFLLPTRKLVHYEMHDLINKCKRNR